MASNSFQEIEQAKAKALEQEKLDILLPVIRALSLRKEEVNALLTLDKKRLRNLAKKLEEFVNAKKKHQTVVHDPTVAAKLLWAIGKSACVSGEKVEQNRMYTARLRGVQVLGCFAVASSLFKAAADQTSSNESNKEIVKQ